MLHWKEQAINLTLTLRLRLRERGFIATGCALQGSIRPQYVDTSKSIKGRVLDNWLTMSDIMGLSCCEACWFEPLLLRGPFSIPCLQQSVYIYIYELLSESGSRICLTHPATSEEERTEMAKQVVASNDYVTLPRR